MYLSQILRVGETSKLPQRPLALDPNGQPDSNPTASIKDIMLAQTTKVVKISTRLNLFTLPRAKFFMPFSLIRLNLSRTNKL